MTAYRSDEQCEIERLRAENGVLKAHIVELREEINNWKRGETDVLLYPFSPHEAGECRFCKRYSVTIAAILEPEQKTRTGWFGKIIHGHPQRFRRECMECKAVYYERTAIDEEMSLNERSAKR